MRLIIHTAIDESEMIVADIAAAMKIVEHTIDIHTYCEPVDFELIDEHITQSFDFVKHEFVIPIN